MPAALLALLVVLLCATPASAHAALRSSNPADGAVVTTLPRDFELVFNEQVDPSFAQVVIEDSAGTNRAQQDLSVRGPSVSGTMPRDLPAGRTTLRYRVVSADGHPVAGDVSFELRTPAASDAVGAPPSPGGSIPAGSPAATAEPAAVATPAPAATPGPTADAAAGSSIGNVTMLALGGIGAIIFGVIVALLLRSDRRSRR